MLRIGFGVPIATEIALPGSVPADAPVRPLLEVAVGALPSWEAVREWGPYRVRDADLFDFTMPGVARYSIVDRRRIVVAPEPGTDEEAVGGMLAATALPALFWARGEIMLHAAAAASLRSRGRLLLGQSGAGKSTVLARALDRGASVVADDSVRVWMEGERVMAAGLPGALALRAHAGLNAPRRRVEVPVDRRLRACEIVSGHVIVPEGEAPRRLRGPEGVAALLWHRHRPRILRLLGTEAALLAPVARVALALRLTAVRL